MFGRNPRKVSIVIDVLRPDPEGARALAGEALSIVELSPALRAAPVCWVLSTRALCSDPDGTLSSLVRRRDHYGDMIATSGYSGFPHPALLRVELAREIGWALNPPAEVAGGPPNQTGLLFPREPDDRFPQLDQAEALGVPYVEGAILPGDDGRLFLRFFDGASRADADAAILTGEDACHDFPETARRKRRVLRSLLPKRAGGDRVELLVFEIMTGPDLATLRLFADAAAVASEKKLTIRPIREALTTHSTDAPTRYRGRRNPFDQVGLVSAAEERRTAAPVPAQAVFHAFDRGYRAVRPVEDPAGGPPYRELGANMSGQAILDEAGFTAVFEAGSLSRITVDGRTILDGPPAGSWIRFGNERFDFQLVDAISFQNETSRGLRSSFAVSADSGLTAGMLIDAVLLNERPLLVLEVLLNIDSVTRSGYVSELIPLCVPLGATKARDTTISCRYPDGEEVRHRIDLETEEHGEGRSEGLFGSRFSYELEDRTGTIAYLHPSDRYVGEAILLTRHERGDRRVYLGVGPLCRGIPATELSGFSERFSLAFYTAEADVRLSPWPSDLSTPAVWIRAGNGEVKS